MKKRKGLSRGKSKRLFSRTSGTHKRNVTASFTMRGGTRM